MTIQKDSAKAWALGIRPTSLAGALMTVALGCGLAHGMYPEKFSWTIAVLCGLFACFMQIAANLINDVVDFDRGLDKCEPDRIDRIYANGLLSLKAMKTGIAASLIIGCAIGILMLALVRENLVWGGWELVLIGAVVVLCTFLYSTTFSYHGMGDLAVILCFGLIPVCGTFYVQSFAICWDAVWASVIAGASIDTLMIINNYRDRLEDASLGKNTSIAVMGEKFGRYLYLIAGLVCVLMLIILKINGRISFLGLAYCAVPYLALHCSSWMKIQKTRTLEAFNIVYYESPRNFTILGILTTIALW